MPMFASRGAYVGKPLHIAMRVDVVEVLPLIRCAIILIDLDEFDVETQLVCAGTTATNFTF